MPQQRRRAMQASMGSVLLPLSLAGLLVVALGSAWLSRSLETRLDAQLETRARGMARVIQAVADSPGELDRVLAERVERLAADDAVAGIVVAGGAPPTILAARDPALVGLPIAAIAGSRWGDRLAQSFARSWAPGAAAQWSGRTLTTTLPAAGGSPAHHGRRVLVLEMDGAGLDAAVRAEAWQAARAIALAIGVLVLLTAALIRVRFIRPVAELETRLQPFAKGRRAGLALRVRQLHDAYTLAVARSDATAMVASVGTFVTSASGRIEAFDAGAERIFGCAASEVIGRSAGALLRSGAGTQAPGVFPALLGLHRSAAPRRSHEVLAGRPDGSELLLDLSLATRENGDGGRAVVAFREHKHDEAADRLALLYAAAEGAYESATEALEAWRKSDADADVEGIRESLDTLRRELATRA